MLLITLRYFLIYATFSQAGVEQPLSFFLNLYASLSSIILVATIILLGAMFYPFRIPAFENHPVRLGIDETLWQFDYINAECYG